MKLTTLTLAAVMAATSASAEIGSFEDAERTYTIAACIADILENLYPGYSSIMRGGDTFGERVARAQLQAANNGEDIDQFAERFHNLMYLDVRLGWYSAEQATQGYEDIMNCASW